MDVYCGKMETFPLVFYYCLTYQPPHPTDSKHAVANNSYRPPWHIMLTCPLSVNSSFLSSISPWKCLYTTCMCRVHVCPCVTFSELSPMKHLNKLVDLKKLLKTSKLIVKFFSIIFLSF